jgi:NTP pyrophosphatase (non-canonical NTP hydrolase)
MPDDSTDNLSKEIKKKLSKKDKSISDLSEIMMLFKKERGWAKAPPNQLIAALFTEMAELAEHYQWQSEFVEEKDLPEDKKKEVGYEFVDVLFYLFEIAARTGDGIDIEQAFNEKVPKLAEKFPKDISPEDYFRRKREYRASGKNKLY